MTWLNDSVLECQQCGTTVRRLTPEEAQQVAADPYRFVVYCDPCATGGIAVDPNLVESTTLRRDRRTGELQP